MGSQDFDTSTGDISDYHGPAQNFPYKAIRYLAASQLIIALLLEIIAIVQLSLGADDRYVFLASGCVLAWTPVPAIAAGVVGITICEERYWEAQCVKTAFNILTVLNGALFMPILVFVTGIVTAAHYDVTDALEADHLLPTLSPGDQEDMEDARLIIVAVILGLGLLMVFICVASILATLCCAPLYSLKDKAIEKKLIGAHNPKQVRGRPVESMVTPRSITGVEPRYASTIPRSNYATSLPPPTRPSQAVGPAGALAPMVPVPSPEPLPQLTQRPVVMAPQSVVMMPGPVAMGRGPVAMGPGPVAMGPRPVFMGGPRPMANPMMQTMIAEPVFITTPSPSLLTN